MLNHTKGTYSPGVAPRCAGNSGGRAALSHSFVAMSVSSEAYCTKDCYKINSGILWLENKMYNVLRLMFILLTKNATVESSDFYF